jgi:hypothetical protein
MIAASAANAANGSSLPTDAFPQLIHLSITNRLALLARSVPSRPSPGPRS